MTTAHATAWYGLSDLARIGRRRQGADSLRHRRGRTGGDRDRSGRRRRDLRHGRQRTNVDNFCATGESSTSTTRAASSSRSRSARDTDGYGVDIVLNSVTGAAQRAGIELLALGGRFIEIGKRDIYGDTRLGLFPFRRNLAFHGVDLGLMSHSHPARFHDLLDTVYRLTADGVLPLPESTHYPLTEAANAIRAMSGRRAHRQAGARRAADRADPGGGATRPGPRLSAATAPTSSPAVWAASDCSWPRSWPRRAAAGSC